ncbi:MAG: hypothetical protein CMJ18_00310 [Phycisphaeraceae bacterium]|nr:hypothetical protein [Phycisphaeraceae bacterium]
MQFAINPITTMNYEFDVDVAAYHAAGITHMEFFVDKVDRYLEQHDLSEVRGLLSAGGLTVIAGICVAQIMLEDVTADPERSTEYRSRLALCRDLDCQVLVFIPENPPDPKRDVYPTMERNLRRACDVAAEYDVRLALEFLQGNTLVSTLATAKQIVRNVDHPALGLLIDLSHFWMGRSDLADLEDLSPDEILLAHVDDMTSIEPEFLTDHDRTFPGQGRGIERHVLPAIEATGYAGHYSLELFNHDIWARPIDQIVSESVESFDFLRRHYGQPDP